MNIGIILHPYGEAKPGGLPRVIFGLVRALLERDTQNEYTIFLKERPSLPVPLPGENWKIEVLGPGRFWLDRLRRFAPLDVYIFNTPALPLFFRPARSIIVAYDFPYKHLAPEGIRDRLFRLLIGWYHQRSFKRANHIVTVSESTRNEVTKLFGVAPQRVTSISHGFNKLSELVPTPVALPERFFVYAGVIKERKNVLRIIEGMYAFKQKNPQRDERLVICGRLPEGVYTERIRRYIKEQKMENDLAFAGHVSESELAYVYRHAVALVFPSLVEGSGLSLLEAMGCGLPVITANIFGPAEIGAGGAALLVDPFDSSAIASAMERIATDADLRKSLSERGLTRSRDFTWEAAADKLLHICESVFSRTT